MEAYAFSGPDSEHMEAGIGRVAHGGTFPMSHIHGVVEEPQPTFGGIQNSAFYIRTLEYKKQVFELREIIWEEGSEVRFAPPILERGQCGFLYV